MKSWDWLAVGNWPFGLLHTLDHQLQAKAECSSKPGVSNIRPDSAMESYYLAHGLRLTLHTKCGVKSWSGIQAGPSTVGIACSTGGQSRAWIDPMQCNACTSLALEPVRMRLCQNQHGGLMQWGTSLHVQPCQPPLPNAECMASSLLQGSLLQGLLGSLYIHHRESAQHVHCMQLLVGLALHLSSRMHGQPGDQSRLTLEPAHKP